MPPGLAIGGLLSLVGIAALSFAIYALLLGGRGQSGGGIGPLSERGIHVVAGIRMLVLGSLSLAGGAYLIWSSL